MNGSVRYRIEGGRRLEGCVTISGAKNAINKQLVASLLTDQPCTFTNVPKTTEVQVILEMLEEVGTIYEWSTKGHLTVHTPQITNTSISQRYSGFNRIPILMISPLLHRAGEATVPVVGGDTIGGRPVNFHVAALEAMGGHLDFSVDRYSASTRRIIGTTVVLPYPSVGATENVLIAATLAQGATTIVGAAVEPEIIDTILFLQKMGALIRLEVDRRIIVEGVSRLHGVIHHTIPDRIEAASFAVAAVATDGRIFAQHSRQEDLIPLLNSLRKVGGEFTVEQGGITFFRAKEYLSQTHIETDVYPGFATDWQPPFVVLLTQASGISVMHETVYEQRFGYTETLRRMGADIDLTDLCLGHKDCRFSDRGHPHSCVIQGPRHLHGESIEIPDIRAGFAYLVSALVAEGVSEISNVHYIERGYANIPERLRAIGASIEVRPFG